MSDFSFFISDLWLVSQPILQFSGASISGTYDSHKPSTDAVYASTSGSNFYADAAYGNTIMNASGGASEFMST